MNFHCSLARMCCFFLIREKARSAKDGLVTSTRYVQCILAREVVGGLAGGRAAVTIAMRSFDVES